MPLNFQYGQTDEKKSFCGKFCLMSQVLPGPSICQLLLERQLCLLL